VAKVSELKERARELEQQGELAKAQAIYQHILKHLEGSPALKGELPLYVKVGDLALKQGDPATAVAMYDRAAEHYARAGSARSIGALAEKIRRADPTRDDAAVPLGRALLAEGHAAAAAEVITRYARRLGRSDVEDLLATVEGERIPAAARRRVELAISLLAVPPEEPIPPAEAEPVAPVARVAQPPPPVPEPATDHSLIIEHGARDPQVVPPAVREPTRVPGRVPPAPEPPPRPEPEREPEQDWLWEPEPEPVARGRPEPPPWPEAQPEPEPVASPEPEPPRRASRPEATPESRSRFEAPPEPAPEPAFAAHVAPDAAPEPASEPEPEPPSRPARRVVAREPRVLVREHSRPRGRWTRPLLVLGVLTVLAAGGLGAAWALGWRPFGGEETPTDDEPPTLAPAFPAPRDPVRADSDSAARDTTEFGPLGFNALVDSPAARPGAVRVPDTAAARRAPAGPDSVPTPALPPAGPAPAARPPALATVVVPPGHAIADEIVVIPGLPIVSVAETRAGGALGHRVVQQAEQGVEVRLVATPGSFGADTVGLGAVQVQTEGDTLAVGSVRLGRYLVDARAAMSVETLAAYLRQLIRARPVN
jgi:hypothetical protein